MSWSIQFETLKVPWYLICDGKKVEQIDEG